MVAEMRDNKIRVFPKAHGPGGNREGTDQEGLPEEEKADEASPTGWAKGLQKVVVGPPE